MQPVLQVCKTYFFQGARKINGSVFNRLLRNRNTSRYLLTSDYCFTSNQRDLIQKDTDTTLLSLIACLFADSLLMFRFEADKNKNEHVVYRDMQLDTSVLGYSFTPKNFLFGEVLLKLQVIWGTHQWKKLILNQEDQCHKLFLYLTVVFLWISFLLCSPASDWEISSSLLGPRKVFCLHPTVVITGAVGWTYCICASPTSCTWVQGMDGDEQKN